MQEKEVTIPGGYGPGKTLSQARTDLKLSHDEVALQLHLAPRQIIALENDDYDNLPEPTYVRGYLRAYALLLGLRPEPVLESYARLLPADKTPVGQKVSMGVDGEATSKEPHIKLASYVVAALIIGLAVAWWQGYDTTSTAPSEDVATLPTEEETHAAAVAAEETGDSMPGSAPTSETAHAPAPALPMASAPVPAVSAPPAPVAPPVARPVAPVKMETPAPAQETAVRPGRARVVLRTEQESWAEVRDGGDSRLLYENVPAGRTVTIEGEAPLSVFLGNVDGVKVEYNGRPYDASRHKRGAVARFVLGANTIAPANSNAPTP